jgi:hypothetical protein
MRPHLGTWCSRRPRQTSAPAPVGRSNAASWLALGGPSRHGPAAVLWDGCCQAHRRGARRTTARRTAPQPRREVDPGMDDEQFLNSYHNAGTPPGPDVPADLAGFMVAADPVLAQAAELLGERAGATKQLDRSKLFSDVARWRPRPAPRGPCRPRDPGCGRRDLIAVGAQQPVQGQPGPAGPQVPDGDVDRRQRWDRDPRRPSRWVRAHSPCQRRSHPSSSLPMVA